VPRIAPSRGPHWGASYHQFLANRGLQATFYRCVLQAIWDSFRLQKGLIFETMQLTAEVPVFHPGELEFEDFPRPIAVSSARSATRTWVPDRRSSQVKKLYIGNLPFSATEDQLHEWFSQVGVTPSGVNLIRDRFTGQSRGFAFVEVTNDEDADRAVNSLNGQNFGGRNLVVNEARPQAERGGGGGGRGGYGGGRGGHGGGHGGRGGGGGGRGGDRGDRGNRW
jgi:cold-inducible RNA-binding protein